MADPTAGSTAGSTAGLPPSSTAGPIDWVLAQRVAARIAGTDHFAQSYHAASLQPDFAELTIQAEQLVQEITGLIPANGAATAHVVTRQEWVQANARSFERLLSPVARRMAGDSPGLFAPVGRKLAGGEVGTLLGYMAKRVLGQYDMLVVDAERNDADVVYYVGSNVLALEKRHGFPPREFRLWLALHEVTHRAQFAGVPWMKDHYLSLVDTTLSAVDPDPRRFLDAIKRAADSVRSGHKLLDDGGLVTLLASPEQRVAIDAVGGLMSLLEGHGDVVMNRAGADVVPSAPRFARVLADRRAQVKGAALLMRRLLGIEAKMKQYEEGERFVEAVERERGFSFLDRVWVEPASLPSLVEIRDPSRWIARMDAHAIA
jgi:coenzyme F420 biosynthesis associated uncharacterized protein